MTMLVNEISFFGVYPQSIIDLQYASQSPRSLNLRSSASQVPGQLNDVTINNSDQAAVLTMCY